MVMSKALYLIYNKMKQSSNNKLPCETFDSYEMCFIYEKMASNAFKYGTLISKVTIMIFFKDFLSVGWYDLFWITKKAAKATFH